MHNYFTYIFFILIFILNPFCGTMILWLFYLLDSNQNKSYTLLVVLMSAMATFINLTKVPENDLYYHTGDYLMAGNLDYFPYLAYKTKEPFFYSFNYFCYHLTNGSVKVWLFILSFVSYLFMLLATVKILTKLKATKSQILLGIIVAVFFPQLFSLSAHLLRQFVAGAIFVYFAVDFIYYKQKKWWLPVLGFLIHSSSIILFPLVFFKKLGNFKNHFSINAFLLVVLLSYQMVAALLLKVIGGGGFLGRLLQRGSADTTFDLGEFNVVNYILMLFMWFVAFIILKRKDGYESENRHFVSIIFALSIFIIVNIQQSELSARMFFYLFFFFPLMLALLFTKKVKGYKELNFMISILFIVFFIYRLSHGTWTYAPLSSLLKFTAIDYLIYIP